MGRKVDTKQAEKKFHISKKQIYELGKKGLCGIHKEGKKWVIPDNTKILISVSEIRRFLIQVIKYKNNSGYTFPRDLCPTEIILKELVNQQYHNGFIGSTAKGSNAIEILENVILTEKGIDIAIGDAQKPQMINIQNFNVNIGPTVNAGLNL